MHTSSTLDIPIAPAVPRHVAIIMDGNGRWATERHLPRTAGHHQGIQAVRGAVETCVRQGVEYLTLFAFSSENWRRPQDEVGLLMNLFLLALEREVGKLRDNGVRLRVIGDLSAFNTKLQAAIEAAQANTAHNTRLNLTIAANYGGRWDIIQAMQRLLQTKPELAQQPLLIDESALSGFLSMNYAPEPDLFIRTGGELRMSNFLLWQLAYTELYFTNEYWPDFDAAAFERAFSSYRHRERRFGRTSGQIQTQPC